MLSKYFTMKNRLFITGKNGLQVCQCCIIRRNMDELRRKREATYTQRISFFREFVERASNRPKKRKLHFSNNGGSIIFNKALSEAVRPPKSSLQHRHIVTKSEEAVSHEAISEKSQETEQLPKRSLQDRLLVIKLGPDHHKTAEAVSHEVISEKSQETEQPVIKSGPDHHKTAEAISEKFQQGELDNVFQKFPMPKNVLHNFYQLLADELKDKSLKVEPIYKSVRLKKGTMAWICSYNLNWPVEIKISAQEVSRKKASALAASKALKALSDHGRIAADGSPLIYTTEDVKKIKKKKQTEIVLDEAVMGHMHNIIEFFEDNMKPVVEATNFDDYLFDDDCSPQEPYSATTKTTKFLGTDQYLAKEKVILPISAYKDSFIELLQENRCLIVKGEPGCGKSSRVPQYVLEAWITETTSLDDFCRIAVTQPRRIAAISLADRVSSERGEKLGHIVGYKVRLKNNFQPRTGRILYCTTGILLRHLQSDPNLSEFSYVILDEAHERDVNTDLLMNLLKRALNKNSRLKLVVMSATIDTEAFSEYFDGAPIFNVPGFTYPVKKHFLDEAAARYPKIMKMSQQDSPQVIHADVVEIINHIHNTKPEGAILVFLPGWEDLAKIQKLILGRNDVAVYLVHSKLKDDEQHKIFSKPPPGIRKVILATNIAETSITIDDVVYVVDTGIHKEKIFDVDKGINVIDMEWISKASANQRAGRAGRCSPGESYHLYSRERYEKFPDYSAPKILNSSLTKVILDTKVFTDNMDSCAFMNSLITPPETSAVKKAIQELKQLDLLDENEKLTPLGRTLANFQLEPNLAKALINGVVFKCVTPIVDIVTLFSEDCQIFGSASLLDKDQVKKIKSQFGRSSDHLALMRIYERWLSLQEDDGEYAAFRFCREANLTPYKMQFVDQLRKVHFDYLNGLYRSVPLSDDYSHNDELVKAVLYSGTGTVLEHRNWDIVKDRLKTNVNVLVTRNNHKATITSESVNYKRLKFPSNFLVYINETRSNLRRTTIVRECSLLPSISVLLFNNNDLELISESKKENMVILGIKNTKLQFLCDKDQALVLIKCKQAIDASYKYLIHQMTHEGKNIPDFLTDWDHILINLNAILARFKVE